MQALQDAGAVVPGNEAPAVMDSSDVVDETVVPQEGEQENGAVIPGAAAEGTNETDGLVEISAYDNMIKQLEEDEKTALVDIAKPYDEQIGGYETLMGEVETKRKGLAQQDETKRKKEEAYRYVAGLGDTISGIANLVGTAHNAANQKQTYNAPELVQRAEALRKQRKLEMDDLNARLDELKRQKNAVESAKGLKQAEIKSAYANQRANVRLAEQKAKEAKEALGMQLGSKEKIEAGKNAVRTYIEERKSKGKTPGQYKDTSTWGKFKDSSGKEFTVDTKKVGPQEVQTAVISQLKKELNNAERNASGEVITAGEYFTAEELQVFGQLLEDMGDPKYRESAKAALEFLVDAHRMDGYVGDYVKSLGVKTKTVEDIFSDVK